MYKVVHKNSIYNSSELEAALIFTKQSLERRYYLIFNEILWSKRLQQEFIVSGISVYEGVKNTTRGKYYFYNEKL